MPGLLPWGQVRGPHFLSNPVHTFPNKQKRLRARSGQPIGIGNPFSKISQGLGGDSRGQRVVHKAGDLPGSHPEGVPAGPGGRHATPRSARRCRCSPGFGPTISPVLTARKNGEHRVRDLGACVRLSLSNREPESAPLILRTNLHPKGALSAVR